MRSCKFTHLVAIICIGAALSSCTSKEDREAKYLKRGIVLFESGEFVKARLEFKNAVKIKPTAAEPYYRIGLIDEAEGELHNAFSNFIHAEEQDPHFAPAERKIGEFYIATGQYDQAKLRLDRLLADLPGDAEGHALLGLLNVGQQHYDEAEGLGRLALTEDPKNERAITELARLYVAKGTQQQAEQIVEQGLQRSPDSVPLMILKYSVCDYFKDTPGMEAALRGMVRLKPRNIDYRTNLALFLIGAGRVDEAEAVWRDAVAASPDDWTVKQRLVVFLSEQRGLDPADKEIQGYIAASPQNDFLYFWLADLYEHHHADDRAVALLEKIVEKDKLEPEALNARNALARLKFATGDRSLAERLLTVVLEKDPGNYQALLLRAKLSFEEENFAAAVTNLRTILQTAPRDAQALQILSETLLRQGRPDLAADTLRQVVEIDPQNTALQVRLAQMKHGSGDNRQAKEILTKVMAAAPGYPIGWETEARIAIDLKEWDEAQAAIAKLSPLAGQKLTADFLQGAILQGKGFDEQALRAFENVAKADPQSVLTEHAVASLVLPAQRTGKLDSVASFIENLHSNSPKVALTLASVYELLNRFPDAAQELDRLIAAKSDQDEVYTARARLYFRAGQSEPASEVLSKGLALLPGNVNLALALSEAQSRAGHYANAISTLSQALDRNPTANAIANNLSDLIADHQFDNAEALEKARRIADRFQESADPRLLDTVAWVYFRLNNLPEAQVLMARAAKSGKLDPLMHYHYGAILLKAGQRDQAKAELQAALVVPNAPYEGIEDARRLLSDL